MWAWSNEDGVNILTGGEKVTVESSVCMQGAGDKEIEFERKEV